MTNRFEASRMGPRGEGTIGWIGRIVRTGIAVAVHLAAGVLLVAPTANAAPPGAVTFHGYGELHYNAPRDGVNTFDFHRLVLGFGTRLADGITFESELDFEHAFTEPELEFAQLDFQHRDGLSLRVGALLVPVGPLNETHEPTRFASVERPYVEKSIVPTTWMEPGAGVYGTLADGALRYRAYVLGGLDASTFRARDGIRAGRQHAAEARAEDVAGAARVEWSPGLSVAFGASGYVGGAGQGDARLDGVTVSIGELDARWGRSALELSAMVAAVFVDGADSVSAVVGETVGERMLGGYAEAAWHVLRTLAPASERDLVAFVRVETFDTHDAVPAGRTRDPALDRDVITAGLALWPAPDVALKIDAEFWSLGNGDERTQVNAAAAFTY